MIESARFTNVNGAYVDFNDDHVPFTEFTTEVDSRFTERAKSQQHGIYPADTYWGKRLFHCTGDLMDENSAAYIARRIALFGAVMPRPQLGYKKAGTLEIQYTGVSEPLSSDCTLDGYPELPMQALSPARTTYQVNFKAFDPRCYGDHQSVSLEYGIVENIGGRTYNKTYNKSYGVVSLGPSSAYVTNGGNYDTAPTVVINGPVDNPRITLQRSDGATFYMTLTGLSLVDYSDSATIDFANRTAIRSNGQNLYDYTVGSDWFLLEPLPLTNVITFSGTTVSSPSRALFSWRNAYMI